MPAVVVNVDTCTASQACITACPYNAIGMVDGPAGEAVAHIYDNCVDCMLCVPACPQQAILTVGEDGAVVTQDVHNGMWVVVFDAGPEALNLVSQASMLASPLGAWTGAVLLGPEGGESALQNAGADMVIHFGQRATDDAHDLVDAVAEVVAERQPEALLLLDSPRSRELAARLAWRLQVGLITDVDRMENDFGERRLLFYKVSMDSPITAVVVTTTRPQLALVTPNT